MSRDRDFKRLVRRRMRKTGESYSTARAHLVRERGSVRRTSDTATGGSAMMPFEQFTEPAQHVLTVAQSEAEHARGGYIGTGHLLWALSAYPDCVAARLLAAVGVEGAVLRAALDRMPPERDPRPDADLTPT